MYNLLVYITYFILIVKVLFSTIGVGVGIDIYDVTFNFSWS